MHLLHPKVLNHFSLQDVAQPQLYRELYPYTQICRTTFDEVMLAPHPAKEMHITDTTFRDGQQARPPYTVAQIKKMFELLYRLGGRSGLISASEFFLYAEKDRKAIEVCRSLGYQFPKITAWTRANKKDLALARDMEFDEVGMLTSVSDYHIFLKLGKTRQQAMDMYLDVASQALEWGIVPRCHFEDITRADIYGFCLPFAQKLMELSRQANLPVKIRLCDTMGYGVPYPGAAMPRSVQGIVHAFTAEAGVPGEQLEWHGHNDFHKGLVNGVTAWLYGCGAVNGTLFGFGERTGNTPVEALAIDYISLTGNDGAADTTVISEIADFFEQELHYSIPHNYPFAGRDFNATSAGVHVDGILKNEEIYNIFDTTLLLGKPVPIIITDKSGRAGVAYWINHNLKLTGTPKEVTKKHPAVGKIYDDIMKAYENGRTTHFSHEEMQQAGILPESYDAEIFYGSYPAIYDREIDPADYYPSYIKSYIEKDVREMKAIEDLSRFKKLVRLCAGRIGQLLNKASLAVECGISAPTVDAWLSILEESYIIYFLRPDYNNFSKRLVKSPKLYFNDTGLACSLLDIRSQAQLSTHYLRGSLFENMVINEFTKRSLNRGNEPALSFWRDSTGHEIDLIVSEEGSQHAYEIKSGATFSTDFFKGLNYWAGLSGAAPSRRTVIYMGETALMTSDGDLRPWKDLG